MVMPPDISSEAYFDRSGRKIKEGRLPRGTGVPASLRAALGIPTQPKRRAEAFTSLETASACLELHSGSTVINIQLTVDVTSISDPPSYTILGVSFSGDICSGPLVTQWRVINGYIGEVLLLEAEQEPLSNEPAVAELAVGSCAQEITIIGFYKNPSTYPGIYGFGGSIFGWPQHTTLFKGWQACS
jgi:hypothetical protein